MFQYGPRGNETDAFVSTDFVVVIKERCNIWWADKFDNNTAERKHSTTYSKLELIFCICF